MLTKLLCFLNQMGKRALQGYITGGPVTIHPRSLRLLGQVLTSLGLDAASALAHSGATEVKDALRARTEAARARGIFGAPVCIVGDELFFGKDRLEFVEDALR